MKIVNENGNVLVVDETTIYEIDGECLKMKEKEKEKDKIKAKDK